MCKKEDIIIGQSIYIAPIDNSINVWDSDILYLYTLQPRPFDTLMLERSYKTFEDIPHDLLKDILGIRLESNIKVSCNIEDGKIMAVDIKEIPVCQVAEITVQIGISNKK